MPTRVELYRATVRIRLASKIVPDVGEFRLVFRELEDRDVDGARRHARRLAKKMYPSAKVRVLKVTHDLVGTRRRLKENA
jgi:hypothetical protein